MAKCTVKAYTPAEGRAQLGPLRSGVIGPISMDIEVEDLKQFLISPRKVLRVIRLPKFTSGKKEESSSIRIDFAGELLPQTVKLGYMSYEVQEFNPPPPRCFRCQIMGRMSGGCTAQERCMICSGSHRREACTNQMAPKCANCGKEHVASSKTCLFNIKAVEINKSMKQGKSFTEAKKLADSKHSNKNSSNYNFPNQNIEMAGNHSSADISDKSYSKVLSSKSEKMLNQQASTSGIITNDTQKMVNDTLTEFCLGMTKFMKEIVSIVSNLPGVEALVERAAATQLGKFTSASKIPVSEKKDTDVNNNIGASSTLSISLSENDVGVLSTDIEENSNVQVVKRKGKKKGKRKNSKNDSESEWTELGRTKKKIANCRQ